jgi:hypothetical protein
MVHFERAWLAPLRTCQWLIFVEPVAQLSRNLFVPQLVRELRYKLQGDK